MNRKKKINETLKKKIKKKNAKLHKSNKPRYISKAERARLEEQEGMSQVESSVDGESDSVLSESE